MIEYKKAKDIERITRDIIKVLNLKYIDPSKVFCVRSKGTVSRHIIARIHGLPKIMQKALNLPPSYVIEVISERFDHLDEKEKLKTIIHEILHIPKAFGGGLLAHKKYVTSRKVEKAYKEYIKSKTRKQIEIIFGR